MAKHSNSSSRLCKYVIAALLIAMSITAGKVRADEATPAESGNSSTEQSSSASDNLGLTVDDINDIGFALQRIRQQAINIYLEATRRKNSAEVKAQVPNLLTVPNQFPKDQSKLLPFRRPWLVYFITTLEPLVHLMKEDLKEIESGAKTEKLTAAKKTALNPLIKDWTQNVLKIDADLSNATQLIDDADKNNIPLAKVAYEIDTTVTKLESIRDKAFRIVYEQPQKKNGVQAKKVR